MPAVSFPQINTYQSRFPSLDFSSLANLPNAFWQGQEVARERDLREALSKGLPTDAQGHIDWAKTAAIVGQYNPELGIRSAAYAQANTLTPYQAGQLGLAQQRENRLAQAPSVSPYQQRMMDLAEKRLKLSEQAAGRLPQNTIGAVAMMDSADKELTGDNRSLLTRDWSPTEMAGAATGIGSVARAQRAVRSKVEASLRLMTGAAAPEQEVARYTDMYMPNYLDSVETKKQKLRLLDEFGANARKNAMQGRPTPEQAPEVAPATQPGELPVYSAPQTETIKTVPETSQLPKLSAAEATRMAQEALAAGKDPAAVRKLLESMGFNLGPE